LQEHPKIDEMAFSTNNGAILKNPLQMILLKLGGLKTGVPDVFIMYPYNGHHGLIIEFKRPDGVVSQEQKTWLANLARHGYFCAVCRTLDNAIKVVAEYFKK